MLKIIGKAIGIALVLLVNYFFWCYVEQDLNSSNWTSISRFLFMTANVYILYKTIITSNEEF